MDDVKNTGTDSTVSVDPADAKAAAVDPAAKKTDDSATTGDETTTKTYDQSYIDKLLAEQEKARKSAVEEALKVAGMDEKSKADYEKQKSEKEMADREAALARRELKADARELLGRKEVPMEFLDILTGASMEETTKNVDTFKAKFDAAVQAQVEKRLVGKTPHNGNGSSAFSEADAMAAEIAKYMN